MEFDAEMGITQRMVAYDEAPNAQRSAPLLPQIADAFIEREKLKQPVSAQEA